MLATMSSGSCSMSISMHLSIGSAGGYDRRPDRSLGEVPAADGLGPVLGANVVGKDRTLSLCTCVMCVAGLLSIEIDLHAFPRTYWTRP
jgi:hypothetical protein